MTLYLKVFVPQKGLSRVIRFGETEFVSAALHEIHDKTEVGGADHGLFIPVLESNISEGGRWMENNKSLASYDLGANQYVEYRKKHQVIEVTFLDGNKKKMQIDVSAPPATSVTQVAEKLSMHPDVSKEFSLKLREKGKQDTWLLNRRSILEQTKCVLGGPMLTLPPEQELIFARKYYFHDNEVTDAWSVALVYQQIKDEILAGLHSLEHEDAITLGALQLQNERGNFSTEKKFDVKSYLPKKYAKIKHVDKELSDKWKTFSDMDNHGSQFKYIQIGRTLKTWGSHSFNVGHVVEVKEGKPTTVPKKLSIHKNGVSLFNKKFIIEKNWGWPLVKGWNGLKTKFILDFGTNEEAPFTFETTQGAELSSLIAGYLDLLIDSFNKQGLPDLENLDTISKVQDLSAVSGQGIASYLQMASFPAEDPMLSQQIYDVPSAEYALNKINLNMLEDPETDVNMSLAPAERKKKMLEMSNLLQSQFALLSESAAPNSKTGLALNQFTKQVAFGMEALAKEAQASHYLGLDPDNLLINATKNLGEALVGFLQATQNAQENPNDQLAQLQLKHAATLVQTNLLNFQEIAKGNVSDPVHAQMMNGLSKGVALAAGNLLTISENMGRGNANVTDQRKFLTEAVEHYSDLRQPLSGIHKTEEGSKMRNEAVDELRRQANALRQALENCPPEQKKVLEQALEQLEKAIRMEEAAAKMRSIGTKGTVEFVKDSQNLIESSMGIHGSVSDPEKLKFHSHNLKVHGGLFSTAVGVVGSQMSDPRSQERLGQYSTDITKAMNGLLSLTEQLQKNSKNQGLIHETRQASQGFNNLVSDTLNEAGSRTLLDSVFLASQGAIGQTGTLVAQSNIPQSKFTDQTAYNNLVQARIGASDALQTFINHLNEDPSKDPDGKELLEHVETFCRAAFKLVAAAKGASSKMNDPKLAQALGQSSDMTAKTIQGLLTTRKATRAMVGATDIRLALETFGAFEATTSSNVMLLGSGLALDPSKDSTKDAIQKANKSIKATVTSISTAVKSANENPQDFGKNILGLVNNLELVNQDITNVAATLPNHKVTQKELMNALTGLNTEMKNLIAVARNVAKQPGDNDLANELSQQAKYVAGAMGKLVKATQDSMNPDTIAKPSRQTQSDLDNELRAANEMEIALENIKERVQNLNQEEKQLSAKPDQEFEDKVNIALLQGASALGNGTLQLMEAATKMQNDMNKLRKDNPSFKRDPEIPKQIIAASQHLEFTFQSLHKAVLEAVNGGDIEGLISGAKAVSEATQKLVQVMSSGSGDTRRLTEAQKLVSQSTSSLVEAAGELKEVRAQQEEKERNANKQSYDLSDRQKQEMEAQIEILKMERLLEMKKKKAMQSKQDSPMPSAASPSQSFKPQGLKPQGLKPQGLKPQGLKPQGLKPQGLKPQLKPVQRN